MRILHAFPLLAAGGKWLLPHLADRTVLASAVPRDGRKFALPNKGIYLRDIKISPGELCDPPKRGTYSWQIIQRGSTSGRL